jgi:hypothetical protein
MKLSIGHYTFDGRRLLGVGLFVALPAIASAAPTPIPGGANAVSAVSAKTGETIFNGVLRVKLDDLRDATDADGAASENPSPGRKVMLMRVLLRNGATATFSDLLRYTLADKDDISYEIPSYKIKNINPNIIQGGALRQTSLFEVDQDFVPTKLIIECATCGAHTAFRPVRIALTSN